jgi:leucyl aminopeptidase
MSLPACFVAARDASSPVSLVVVDRTTYPAWRDAHAPATGAWLDANAFSPSAGSFALLPGADGRLACVLAAVGDAADPLALAHLPQLLPPGDFALDPDSPVRIAAADALLGWGLGAYRFDKYVAPTRSPARLVLDDAASGEGAALALLRASTLVRDLVNTPTEHMGPADLQATAERLAAAYGGRVRSIVGEELLAHNFPTIHAVGRAAGAGREPRLIELEWGSESHPHVVVCGKGVCFDTGGLDLKSHDGMRHMKKDMGGSAHALALAQLVMSAQLPVRLTVLIGAVENAIAGNAFRPGEVLVTRKGYSVEVDNTDAEGRLVLCDALAYAGEKKPALVLDFATLTGAARIALGPDLPMLFCNDEGIAAAYLAAGERSHDRLWRMPLWRPYLTHLKSPIADMSNGGPSRMAGAIVAALYLERFVPEGQPWVHVDVYAWNDNDRPGKPFGGEAQGLRAAFEFLRTWPGN